MSLGGRSNGIMSMSMSHLWSAVNDATSRLCPDVLQVREFHGGDRLRKVKTPGVQQRPSHFLSVGGVRPSGHIASLLCLTHIALANAKKCVMRGRTNMLP